MVISQGDERFPKSLVYIHKRRFPIGGRERAVRPDKEYPDRLAAAEGVRL
ncbi:MAG: hypothetical protein NZM29_02000 [Nitrospira sp.]|nr:hypothetical protein [Nitrospira sp.]